MLTSCHIDPTAGHLGEKKTISRISERFFWTGIVKDAKQMVHNYSQLVQICTFPSFMILYDYMHQISSCDVCQKVNRKIASKTPELHPIKVKSPWYHVGIDFVGPLTPVSTGGNHYILVIISQNSQRQWHCLIKQHLVLHKHCSRYIATWFVD